MEVSVSQMLEVSLLQEQKNDTELISHANVKSHFLMISAENLQHLINRYFLHGDGFARICWVCFDTWHADNRCKDDQSARYCRCLLCQDDFNGDNFAMSLCHSCVKTTQTKTCGRKIY